MAMGKRQDSTQGSLFIPTASLARSSSHAFYERLNQVLAKDGFDAFSEGLCAPYYVEGKGRPGISPGTYFRMHLAGYFEGLESERLICWRVSDSLALRPFLGYDLTQSTPDHSTLSRIRQRLPVEVHLEVFTWILQVLSKADLLKGKTLAVDATTLEANAALRSLCRRDSGLPYEAYLTELAKESGIETPTREDLTKLDKKRKKTTSNDDWEHPHDPRRQGHEDEGQAHPSGAQGRARGRPGDASRRRCESGRRQRRRHRVDALEFAERRIESGSGGRGCAGSEQAA